jgi:pyruvate/2-oxoglutarate dehydrogenase complex dihydrolipoamide acyltransferase (E2) component
MKKVYSIQPLSFNRRLVAASASVTSAKNTFHSLAQVDISEPRRLLKSQFEKTGVKLSFTAYIVYCLAQVIRDHPHLNSFIRRNRLITLDDVTISVLVEREFDGEKVPEPASIKGAQRLSFLEISQRIREAKENPGSAMGKVSGKGWIRCIPGFLLRTFIRIADRNLRLAKQYGKVAVTAVGMFSEEPVWFIPHGSATILITVGSIEKRQVLMENRYETREFLCVTGSFDHDIVDGAPAARFMNQFLETVRSGRYLAFDSWQR